MSGSVNRAILVGVLGRDPEIRSTVGGDKIATMSLATSESWRDKNTGERRENTTWHRVVVFNDRLAEIAEKHLRKGARIYVDGAIQSRKYTDQQGQERHVTEVVLQRFRGELVMLGDSGEREERPRQQERSGGGTSAADDPTETIPF